MGSGKTSLTVKTFHTNCRFYRVTRHMNNPFMTTGIELHTVVPESLRNPSEFSISMYILCIICISAYI